MDYTIEKRRKAKKNYLHATAHMSPTINALPEADMMSKTWAYGQMLRRKGTGKASVKLVQKYQRPLRCPRFACGLPLLGMYIITHRAPAPGSAAAQQVARQLGANIITHRAPAPGSDKEATPVSSLAPCAAVASLKPEIIMKLFSKTALLALCLEALLHSSLLTGLCEGGDHPSPRALAEAPAKEPATTTKNNKTNATGGVTTTNATSDDANSGMNVTVALLSDFGMEEEGMEGRRKRRRGGGGDFGVSDDKCTPNKYTCNPNKCCFDCADSQDGGSGKGLFPCMDCTCGPPCMGFPGDPGNCN